jgi:hypothetical protein
METMMISLKVLSTAAALALLLPLAAPTASFAQGGLKGAAAGGHGGGGGFHGGGGGFHGGGFHGGGHGGGFHGGGYHGGFAGGGYHHGGGGGFLPGAVAGALVGGAIAAGTGYGSYGYYDGGPGYYDGGPGYYDGGYGGDEVAVVPGPVGGDAVGYCEQRYKSYDPASGTYLGYDGLRHPCP